MRWWFGRKSAADLRPFVPAWLGTNEDAGFARSRQGMSMNVRSAGALATFQDGSWVIGELRGSRLLIGGEQVVGPRSGAIAVPAGGSTVDVEGRGTIEAILVALRGHGLIEA